MKYKIILLLITVIIFSQGCKKEIEEETEDYDSSKIVFHKLNTVFDYRRHQSLDINEDGKTDYYFTTELFEINGSPYLYFYVNQKGAFGNHILLKSGPDTDVDGLWAQPLNSGEKITAEVSANLEWHSYRSGLLINISETDIEKTYEGLWVDKKQRYLGIKFMRNGQTHYGWVKLSHDKNQDEILIESYAYNSSPNKSIRAGQEF